jgi:hypothetical protein
VFSPGLPLYQLQIAHKDQVENRHQQKGDESRRLTRRSVANISPLWRRPPRPWARATGRTDPSAHSEPAYICSSVFPRVSRTVAHTKGRETIAARA